jgi:hypothetical protein
MDSHVQEIEPVDAAHRASLRFTGRITPPAAATQGHLRQMKDTCGNTPCQHADTPMPSRIVLDLPHPITSTDPRL